MAKVVNKTKATVDRVPAAEKVDTDAFDAFQPEDLGPQPLAVPGVKRPPLGKMQGGMYWFYGVEKIGKTTIASKFPGAWFWASEPGQDWVEVYEPTIINDWDHLLSLCGYIQEHKPTKFGDGRPIRTIVMDTADGLFKMCTEYVSQQCGVQDPSEGDHGKVWGRLNNEFERVITKIRRWPFTLVCLSHDRQRPFKTKGRQVDRWEPDIGAGGRRILAGAADLIMWAHTAEEVTYDDDGNAVGAIEKRMLQCHPSASVVAGGRNAHLLPPVIPLDYNELEAYLTGKKTYTKE
jgi:hypothetical protein